MKLFVLSSRRQLPRAAACAAVAALVAGFHSTGTARAEAPVAVTLSPTTCLDPCTVRVRTEISADAQNRSLAIKAESSEYLRRSVIQLDGADAARAYFEVFKGLPAGAYEITATVERSTGAAFSATRDLAVRGSSVGGGSAAPDPQSVIRDPRSVIRDQGSMIHDQGFSIRD